MIEALTDLEFDILEAAIAEEALQILADMESVAVLIADMEPAGR